MKSIFFSCFAFCSLLLTACSHSTPSTSLNPLLYQGYWAMKPIDERYRVMQFHANGQITAYDYTCDQRQKRYQESGRETLYLRQGKNRRFILLDHAKQPFAQFEILNVSPKAFQAKQYFAQESPLLLHYQHQARPQPLC